VHRLADRDDRVPGLAGDPLGGAVPGAGLLGRDRRVGHEVDGGAHDPGAVAGQHDRAVHLAQFAQAGARRTPRRAGSRRCTGPRRPCRGRARSRRRSAPAGIRSRPSRSAVPGATSASVARNGPSRSIGTRHSLRSSLSPSAEVAAEVWRTAS
jgi:hypothetical protein